MASGPFEGMFDGLSDIPSHLRDLVGALGGAAEPQRIEDYPGMLPGTATIVADEGQRMAVNSGAFALQLQTYIVDVHPANGTDPAIRAEVACWVSWINLPAVGDTVPAGYLPGTTTVALLLAGDPNWDWQLAATLKQSAHAAQRAALLSAPPDSTAPRPKPKDELP
jgi:hypothetical protein